MCVGHESGDLRTNINAYISITYTQRSRKFVKKGSKFSHGCWHKTPCLMPIHIALLGTLQMTLISWVHECSLHYLRLQGNLEISGIKLSDLVTGLGSSLLISGNDWHPTFMVVILVLSGLIFLVQRSMISMLMKLIPHNMT